MENELFGCRDWRSHSLVYAMATPPLKAVPTLPLYTYAAAPAEAVTVPPLVAVA